MDVYISIMFITSAMLNPIVTANSQACIVDATSNLRLYRMY